MAVKGLKTQGRNPDITRTQNEFHPISNGRGLLCSELRSWGEIGSYDE